MNVNIADLKEVKKRFLSKIFKPKTYSCWLWDAHKDKDGYGRITVSGKDFRAHRLSWLIYKGKLTKNICVLHKCDTPQCVKPGHLFLGTNKDNYLDCVAKGRSFIAKSSAALKKRKCCNNGHEYNKENTYIWRNKRVCRTCRRINIANLRKRLREVNCG